MKLNYCHILGIALFVVSFTVTTVLIKVGYHEKMMLNIRPIATLVSVLIVYLGNYVDKKKGKITEDDTPELEI